MVKRRVMVKTLGVAVRQAGPDLQAMATSLLVTAMAFYGIPPRSRASNAVAFVR